MKSFEARDFSNGRAIEVFCPHCGYVFQTGRFVIALCEDGEPKGLISDSTLECCGQPLIGPKVFETLPAATLSLQLLFGGRKIEVLPMNLFR